MTFRRHNSSGECRARSDCTYVQADLDLHSPQIKYMVVNGWIRDQRSIVKMLVELTHGKTLTLCLFLTSLIKNISVVSQIQFGVDSGLS